MQKAGSLRPGLHSLDPTFKAHQFSNIAPSMDTQTMSLNEESRTTLRLAQKRADASFEEMQRTSAELTAIKNAIRRAAKAIETLQKRSAGADKPSQESNILLLQEACRRLKTARAKAVLRFGDAVKRTQVDEAAVWQACQAHDQRLAQKWS